MSNNLNTSIKNMKFDTRMVDYNIKQGIMTSDEYEQHLSQLNDSSHNFVPLELFPQETSTEEIENNPSSAFPKEPDSTTSLASEPTAIFSPNHPPFSVPEASSVE